MVNVNLINMGHKLTEEQLEQIKSMVGDVNVVEMPVQLDLEAPIAPQIIERLEVEEPVILNLPGYAPAAAVVLAEIHGRIGHFPSVIRLKPAAGSAVTKYEVAEIINLQEIRETARTKR